MRHQPTLRHDLAGSPTSPLWLDTAAPAPSLSPLVGSKQADVLVVGGGIAGLTTALHLAEAGVDVALLEARHLGAGATGQSGGLVAPAIHDAFEAFSKEVFHLPGAY